MRKQIDYWTIRGSTTSTLPLGMALVFVWMILTSLSYQVGASESDTPIAGGPNLVELFTSHGCSSCPAADRLLGELLENDPSLMALEYHVDYWNTLVHGSDGNFVDPFSKSEYSMRQREYNVAQLAGRPGVYTPQMIINGKIAAVGSNRRHIQKALSVGMDTTLDVVVDKAAISDAQASLAIRISGNDDQRKVLDGTDIMLVRYYDSALTEITGGENRNLTLENHHIVFNVTRVGEVTHTGDMMFTVAGPAPGEGCVVLVQEGALTPVYAAAECP